MNTQTMHHQQQEPSYNLQAPAASAATQGGDDRSTSPTVVVTTTQVMKEGEQNNMSPNQSTAATSSAHSSPMSGSAAYDAVPNPVPSYPAIPEALHQMETDEATKVAGSARPTTPSMVHYASQHHHGSRDPLSSPMSASTLHGNNNPRWSSSAPPSTNNTPVPAEIHTSNEPNGRGPFPYFPSALRNSASSNSVSSKTSTKSVQIVSKKRHSAKSSASVTSNGSLHPDEVMTVTEGGSIINGNGGVVVTARRQKRLERNRESARLSRRRRKQYLEVLEERVTQLSVEVDQGRRQHATEAIASIQKKRNQVLEQTMAEFQQQTSSANLEHNLWLLEEGPLSRNSSSLLVLTAFLKQQLKSFSLPSQNKFTLWLTLQNDLYFRGGRAASERLSAARIGERMLANGTDKATPTNSMWPLVCNEIGLSYDQEERVRQYQKVLVLQDSNTWLDRHTARSSSLVMESFHDAVVSMSTVLGQRERKLKQILNPEQRLKFLAWANQKTARLPKFQRHSKEKLTSGMIKEETRSADDSRDDGDSDSKSYRLESSNHVAANLYILNHRLQNVLKEFPYHPPVIITTASLKKLSRRASFESLGQQKDSEGRLLTRDTSFASMGSLKTSASSMSLTESSAENLEKLDQASQINPEDAERAASPIVEEVLGFVKSIIPAFSPPRMVAVPSSPSLTSHQTMVNPHYTTTSASVPSFADPQTPAPALYVHYTAPSAPVLTGLPSQSYASGHVQVVSQQQLPEHQGQQMVVHYHHDPSIAPPATTQNPSLSPQYTHPIQAPQQYQQPLQVQYNSYPEAASAPVQQTAPEPFPVQTISPEYVSVANMPLAATPAPYQQFIEQPMHSRKSSFLPAHLNVVPEDMFPAGDVVAEDFLAGLMEDEDWAIGEGIDMDTTA